MSTSEAKIPKKIYQEFRKNLENSSQNLLNLGSHALVLVDNEGRLIFPVDSIAKVEIRNNIEILAYYSKLSKVPIILSTVLEHDSAGQMMNKIKQFHSDAPVYGRSRISLNIWEDTRALEAVIATGTKRLVMAGLWADVCFGLTILCALKSGYEVYIVTDASGANSVEAHQISIQKIVQAGAIPITTTRYVSEILRFYERADPVFSEMNLNASYPTY